MEIKRIVVFGDSLQDNGNLIKTLGIPAAPYEGGRFSNGKIACEYLIAKINRNRSETKKTIQLKNYAIGGAYTSGKNPKSLLDGHSFSVSDQIDRFIAEKGRFNTDDLVMLNGGGNNFLFALHNEKPYFNLPGIYRVANDLIEFANRLVKLGAKTLLPDVTTAPAYRMIRLPAVLIHLLKKYLKWNLQRQNQKLEKGLTELKFKYPEAKLRLFDVHQLLLNVLDAPQGYGFENTRDACVKSFGGTDEKGNFQTSLNIDQDPETHLFWDYTHPTTKAQKMLAEHMFKLLYPLAEE